MKATFIAVVMFALMMFIGAGMAWMIGCRDPYVAGLGGVVMFLLIAHYEKHP